MRATFFCRVLLTSPTLADLQKILVELACGAAAVPVSNKSLFDYIRETHLASRPMKTVVAIMCGGFKIDVGDLGAYKKHLAAQPVPKEVYVNGRWVTLE